MKNLFLIFLTLSLTAYGLYSQNSVILEITGNVELKPAGSSAFTTASPGDEIAPDTIISTGFNSTAVISAGNSIITVYPLAYLSFSEKTKINLQTGRIKVDTDPSLCAITNFTVSSPASSTASPADTASVIQGTNFEFNTFNVSVNGGKATFLGASGPAIIVNEGREASIGPDGRPFTSPLSSILSSAPGSSRGSSSGSQPSASSGADASGGSSGGSCCD